MVLLLVVVVLLCIGVTRGWEGTSVRVGRMEGKGCDSGVEVYEMYVEKRAQEELRAVSMSSMVPIDVKLIYQHPLGGHIAPSYNLIQAYPPLACDSFVTFGLSHRLTSTFDCTSLAPDFRMLNLSGSWYCNTPMIAPILLPSVRILQLGLLQQATPILQLRLYTRAARSCLALVYLGNFTGTRTFPCQPLPDVNVSYAVTGSPAPTSPPAGESSSLWGVGLAVGLVALFALVVLLIALFVARRRRRRMSATFSEGFIADVPMEIMPKSISSGLRKDPSVKQENLAGEEKSVEVEYSDFL